MHFRVPTHTRRKPNAPPAMCTENYDPCYPDQPVVDRYLPLWAKLPAFAAKPAFIWAVDDDAASSRAALTYSQLDSAVERMARSLLGTLRRGDAVLVLASPGLRLVKLLFASQRAGLTAVPVIPPDPARFGPAHEHLLRAVSQTRPRAAVAVAGYIDAVAKTSAASIGGGESGSGRLAAMLRSLRWLAVDELERGGGGGVPGSAAAGYVGCGPEDVYLIQYTSGATGVAKPVMITAGSAAHNVRAARKAYDLCPGSVVVSWLPQYHDCGLMFLLLTVVTGATCVLAAPDAFVRRPRLWLELITEFRATCTPVPSFTLPLVLRRGRSSAHGRSLELGSMRNLILINEPIYKSSVDEFVEAFGRDGLRATSISPSYGLAENCTFVSTAWRSACSDLPSYMKLLPSARLSPPSSLGNEGPEIEIAVVDEETGEPVEDGVEGEIWVSSPSNASGYLGHPSATREVFCARVPGTAGACFVRTGDRGVVEGPERYLYVVGRSADVIALDGGRRRVHAHYVETVAFGSASDRLRGGCVAAFAASTTPRSLSHTYVAVVAELQKGSGGDHRGLCDRIKAAVWREEGVRVGLVVLVGGGEVPKTTSGKLRRGAARETLLAGKLRVVFEARYDGGDSSVVGVGGGEGEEKSASGCLAGEPGETDMATAFGSASRRLRLRSFL
ncbi:Long-chain-fatty-acid--AMP ligase FadD29 [Dichanthelium oligosanthes]|uniref:Long-chain-fatty-acid--AMP ligase FadD29 n=1 Tax=Dichanthelium oligosanthes TaxID=888268 RepID=A0A1E5UWG2_9POAL|nr:Long-chain-fatty-acid--AMP ligase FadD29 [Dichanthelium oligosanthes]